jgi:hypothetical protein
MAGPAYYDATVNIALNEDWVVPFTYGTLNADGVTVSPIDLTGSTLKMEIRATESDNEAIVAVSTAPNDGIYFNDGNPKLGKFFVAMERGRLWRLYPGQFTIDMVRTMPSGWQERLWEGIATVVTGTTR